MFILIDIYVYMCIYIYIYIYIFLCKLTPMRTFMHKCANVKIYV